MFTWDRFAYFLLLVLCVAQTVVIDYLLLQGGLQYLYLLVPVDLSTLGAIALNNDCNYAATRGGTAWVLHAWTLALKTALSYFTPIHDTLKEAGVVIAGAWGASQEFVIFMYITPSVYALLSFRSYDQLFGSSLAFSIETMIHADTIMHVLLDLWDITAAFSLFVRLPQNVLSLSPALRISAGVTICTAFFLHAFSFTSVGSSVSDNDESKAEGSGSAISRSPPSPRVLQDAGDVFLIRKHAALVGICLVNAPLLSYRLALWLLYPSYNVLSPFLFKNLLCIILQIMSISHVSAATAARQIGQDRFSATVRQSVGTSSYVGLDNEARKQEFTSAPRGASLPPDNSNTPLENLPLARYEGASDQDIMSNEEENGRHSDTIGSEAEGEPVGLTAHSKKQLLKHLSFLRPNGMFRRRSIAGPVQKPAGHEPPASVRRSSQDRVTHSTLVRLVKDEENIQNLIDTLSAQTMDRTLPVGGFDSSKLFKRLFFNISIFNSRHHFTTLLDSVLQLPYWKLLRMAFPFMLLWLVQLSTVTILISARNKSQVVPDSSPSGIDYCLTPRSAKGRKLEAPDWKEYNIVHPFQPSLFQEEARDVTPPKSLSHPFHPNRTQVRRLGVTHTVPPSTQGHSEMLKAYLAYFPIQIFDLTVIRAISLTDLPTDVIVCLIMICGQIATMLFLWLFAAPHLDVLFCCGLCGLQTFSFFLTVLTFRDFRLFTTFLGLKNVASNLDMWVHPLWLFAVEPVIGILSTLYTFLSALLGKPYLGYIVPQQNKKSALQGIADLTARTGTADLSAPVPDIHSADISGRRSDEAGTLQTTGMILYLNCKHAVAPISVHELAIGPDLINSIRLSNLLLNCHFKIVCFSALIKLWTISAYAGFPITVAYGTNANYLENVEKAIICPSRLLSDNQSNRFDFAIIVLCLHFLLHVIYMCGSQLIRILAIRRTELKSLYTDLTLTKQNSASAPVRVGHGVRIPHGTDTTSVIRKYKIHGAYSPYKLLPSML